MMVDPFNIEGAQEKFDERQKRIEDRDKSDFLKLAERAEFRRLSYKIFRVTGRLGGSASPFDATHSQMCRKVGRWEIGNALHLLYEREAPDKLALMIREAESDQLLRETERREEQGDSNA